MVVLRTNEANCRDCYACVRACPVKAIRVNTGHAEIVPELCILDGSCIAACPQGAKQVSEHTTSAETLLSQGKTAFSMAPSVVANFSESPGVLAAALRRLGAVAVGETAETSGWVSRLHAEQVERHGAVISSSCPAIVNLVTTYYPGALPYLAKVVSPMVAHGRVIKQALGCDTNVVFVGPCIAKKGEMEAVQVQGSIDAVLTFSELRSLLDRRLPEWMQLPEETLDTFIESDVTSNSYRLFPLPGGMMDVLGAQNRKPEYSTLVITGVEQCMELLADIPVHGMPAALVEMMACNHGCINGPAITDRTPVFRRRQRVSSYAALQPRNDGSVMNHAVRYQEVPLDREFTDTRPVMSQPSEDEVRAILESIGKRQASDELNCGACGYPSCRAKAIAVFQGMAEREMCIPYMRSKAESMAEVVIAATPTGVVVINRNLYVLAVNPAAEKMLKCRVGDHVGRPLWRLFEPTRVAQVFDTQKASTGVVHYEKQGLVAREYLVYDNRNDLVIALLTDITAESQRSAEFEALRTTTLDRAQEVINEQMRVAQEIAGLLGETTAETKAILTQLMRLFKEREEPGYGPA